MIDWIPIRNEYISGSISYRALARKYGVSVSRICARASAENWVKLRDEQRYKIGSKVGQKTAEKIAEAESDRLARLYRLTDDVLDLLEDAVRSLGCNPDGVDTRRLRQVVQSMKDIREIAAERTGEGGAQEAGVVILPDILSPDASQDAGGGEDG